MYTLYSLALPVLISRTEWCEITRYSRWFATTGKEDDNVAVASFLCANHVICRSVDPSNATTLYLLVLQHPGLNIQTGASNGDLQSVVVRFNLPLACPVIFVLKIYQLVLFCSNYQQSSESQSSNANNPNVSIPRQK